MNDDRPPDPVALQAMTLTADGPLPAAGWDDLIARLTPPEGQTDPAPGVEFAPVELPTAVHESVMERVRTLAADNPRRKAEREANPPPPAEHRRRSGSRVERVTGEFPNVGGELRAELEDAEDASRATRS